MYVPAYVQQFPSPSDGTREVRRMNELYAEAILDGRRASRWRVSVDVRDALARYVECHSFGAHRPERAQAILVMLGLFVDVDANLPPRSILLE